MSTKNPNKQRLRAFNSSMHIARKNIRARLATKDEKYAGIRSVTVRVGDTVEVQRGDFGTPSMGKRNKDKRGRAGVEAKVIGIDSSNGKIVIEGVTHSKADNKEVAYPIHVSNVVVTKLDESDPVRIKKLLNRGDSK